MAEKKIVNMKDDQKIKSSLGIAEDVGVVISSFIIAKAIYSFDQMAVLAKLLHSGCVLRS